MEEKKQKKSGYAYLQEKLKAAEEENKILRERLQDAQADYLKEYRELWRWLGPVRRFIWKLKHHQL